MKTIYAAALTILILCFSIDILGQNVERKLVGNAGQSLTNGLHCEFSVGEIVISSGYYYDYFISAGFQQAFTDTLYSNIEETSAELSMLCYPVPAREVLYLEIPESGPMAVHIYESSGRIINSLIWPENTDRLQLDLSSYTPGLYFIKVESEEFPVKSIVFVKIN